jgi:hypothetical protein
MCGLDQHWALPISEESALTGGAKESALAGKANESALAGIANESALAGRAPLSNESALTRQVETAPPLPLMSAIS